MTHPTIQSKLHLDLKIVDQARISARAIAEDMQHFINRHTTDSVERTVCRLLGIDGVNKFDVPLPNVVVEHIKKTKSRPPNIQEIKMNCENCEWYREAEDIVTTKPYKRCTAPAEVLIHKGCE